MLVAPATNYISEPFPQLVLNRSRKTCLACGKVKHELRVTSSNPRVTSSNLRVTSSNPRVRVQIHELED